MQSMNTSHPLQGRYKLDARPSVFGQSITVWDGDQEVGRAFQLFSSNWAVVSSRCQSPKVYKDSDKAIDAIIFDWEGCKLDSGRLSEWLIDRMAG